LTELIERYEIGEAALLGKKGPNLIRSIQSNQYNTIGYWMINSQV